MGWKRLRPDDLCRGILRRQTHLALHLDLLFILRPSASCMSRDDGDLRYKGRTTSRAGSCPCENRVSWRIRLLRG